MLYDKRNCEAVMYLESIVAKKVLALLDRLEQLGIEVLITDGKRTADEQDALFKKGGVTHVYDSNSYHVWGMAVDIAPIGIFGRLAYGDTKAYEAIAREARILGFAWGYTLWGFDKPHFQYTQGLTIKQLKGGARLLPEPSRVVNREVVLQSRARMLRRLINRATGRVRMMAENQLRNLLKRK